jgi:predicted phage baseplate assembly protein
VRWHAVPDFWASGPRDRHYTFDAATGTVAFGDGVNGMIPPSGTGNVRAAWYRSGGGPSGNVAAGAITQLKTTVALVDRVINHEPAVGGAPIEPAADTMSRASRTLRHGYRAVTAQDFADLALESSRAVARAVAITPSFSPIDWQDLAHPHELNRDGQVIVVIVPAAAQPGRSPSIDLLAEVADYLRARCTPDTRLQVTGPTWVASDIEVHVASTALDNSDATIAAVTAAIQQLLDPVTGGTGGGWEFGRPPRRSDLLACIAAVPGVDHVSQITIHNPPFDNDDFGGQIPGIDPLSLVPRLLFYARSVTVTASRREVP